MKSVASNLANLKPNLEWASLPLFDRTGWKRVRFGDVVENCAETCDPQDAGLERFIAMEHLEPGSLHIRSWGNVADGTTFTRRCQPGQVLFGKRRAYQRKVAVAEFEAVVSGDIYVLAPKDTRRLLPELLPFLCLSERFFQHAVGTSAGSLSPRTNWSSLTSFEFDLPPLDQQRRIAEILWKVDEAIQNWNNVEKRLEELRLSYANEAYGLSKKPANTSHRKRLSELVEINPSLGEKLADHTEVSFITMADVSETGNVFHSENRQYKDVKKGFTTFRDGDVLFAKITPCMENGKGALVSGLINGIGFGSTEFHVLRPKISEDNDFVFHLTKNPHFRREAKRFMRGSAGQQRVPSEFLSNFEIHIPDQRRRLEIGKQLRHITDQIEHVSSLKSNLSAITTSLLATLFKG
jgi:type I restriction enzyme S subunit